jgi:hypothetical protein
MRKKTLIYELPLAFGAFTLHWLEKQYAVRLFSADEALDSHVRKHCRFHYGGMV